MTINAWTFKEGTCFQAKGVARRAYQVHKVNQRTNTALLRHLSGSGEPCGGFVEVNRARLMEITEKILN